MRQNYILKSFLSCPKTSLGFCVGAAVAVKTHEEGEGRNERRKKKGWEEGAVVWRQRTCAWYLGNPGLNLAYFLLLLWFQTLKSNCDWMNTSLAKYVRKTEMCGKCNIFKRKKKEDGLTLTRRKLQVEKPGKLIGI